MTWILRSNEQEECEDNSQGSQSWVTSHGHVFVMNCSFAWLRLPPLLYVQPSVPLLRPIKNHSTSTKSSSELSPLIVYRVPPQQLRILSLHLNAPSTYSLCLSWDLLHCALKHLCVFASLKKMLLHMLCHQTLRKTQAAEHVLLLSVYKYGYSERLSDLPHATEPKSEVGLFVPSS